MHADTEKETICMRYPITFTNEGQLLIGVVHRPDADHNGRTKRPGVVFFHGFTGTKVEGHRMFVKMAERLASMGIVALRFDFRGSGDSEGDFIDMTFGGEVSDALRACDYIVKYEDVDPERLGVLGLSMGGAVAACVTGRYGKVRSTALWAAVADLALFKEAAKDIGDVDYFDRRGNLVGRQFIEQLDGYTPLEEITLHRTPVLVVHGSDDETVPVDHAFRYRDALQSAGSRYQIHVVEGADHTFNAHPWESEVIDVTARWFAETL